MNFVAHLQKKNKEEEPKILRTKVAYFFFALFSQINCLQMSMKQDCYVATAAFVSEAALIMAFQRNEIFPSGGVLTPAVAMGDALIKKLEKRGVSFSAQGPHSKKSE